MLENKNPPPLNPPSLQRKPTLLRKQTHQLSNFHYESLIIKQENEAPDIKSANSVQSQSNAANPWLLSQLKPSSELNSRQNSKKNLVLQKESGSLSDLNPSKNEIENMKSDRSLEDIFNEIVTPDSAGINIPKAFPQNDNKFASEKSIHASSIPQIPPRFSSIGDLPSPAIFEKSLLEPQALSFEVANRTDQSFATIVRPDQRSLSANPIPNLLSIQKVQSADPIETKESSAALKTRSNFWKEAFSPFFSKKSSHAKSEKPADRSERRLSHFSEKNTPDKIPLQAEDTSSPDIIRSHRIELSRLEIDQDLIPSISVHVPKSRKVVGMIRQIVFLIVLVGFCAAAITVIASAAAYSARDVKTFLWLDEFFDGFLLGASLMVFLKSMITSNFTEETQENGKIPAKHQLIVKGRRSLTFMRKISFVSILSGFIILISSLIMVLFSKLLLPQLSNPLYYLLKGVAVLVVSALIIYPCMKSRNNYLRRQAIKQRGKGFFGLPVYKDFMSDLSSTRAGLETSKPAQASLANAALGTKAASKQDPFKPKKQEFEVVSKNRIISCQILLILLYVQFIATAGFADLQKNLEEEGDNLFILVIVGHPAIALLFRRVSIFINRKIDLSMEIFINYTNFLVFGIFPRMTFLFMGEFRFIYLTICLKVAYKLALYIFKKREIDTMKVNDFMKAIFKDLADRIPKSQRDKDESNLSNFDIDRSQLDKRSRYNSIMKLKNDKLDKDQRKKKEELAIKLFYTVVLVELSDLVFTLGTIGLALYFKSQKDTHYLGSLDELRGETYITATWIEMAFSYSLTAGLVLFWMIRGGLREYVKVTVVKTILSKYLVHFFVVNLMFFLNFLNIIQILDGKSCCFGNY